MCSFIFSDEQQKVINSRASLIIVDAGAGVGKTTVLTERVTKLVEEGENPSSIVALSFTRDSAKTLKDRINFPIHSRTLHSLALRIMRVAEHQKKFPIFSISSEETNVSDARNIFIDIIKENKIKEVSIEEVLKRGKGTNDSSKKRSLQKEGYIFNKKRGNKVNISENETKIITSILNVVDLYYMRSVCPDESYERDLRISLRLTGKSLVQICGGFYYAENIPLMKIISKLTEKDYEMMYSDDKIKVRMGQICTLASKYYDKEIAREMFKEDQISNLLIDEVQDIDDGQISFINALNAKSLFIVGDTNQSLYAFRYVVPDVINRAEELFPEYAQKGSIKLELTINRRCPEDVLKSSNNLIEKNGRSKILRACNEQKNKKGIIINGNETYFDYHDSVIEKIKNIVKEENGNYKKIAIIARYYSVLNDIETSLLKEQIPVRIKKEKSFSQSNIVYLITKFISVLVYEQDVDNFHSLLYILNKQLSSPIKFGANAKKLIEEKIENGVSIIDALNTLLNEGSYSDDTGNLKALSDMFNRFSKMIDDDLPVKTLIQYIFDTPIIRKWSEIIKDNISFINEYSYMLDIASNSYDAEDYIDLLSINETVDIGSANAVNLTTIHSSKGLEWDYVFLLGFEAETFPSKSIVNYSSEIRPPKNKYEIQSTGDLMEERRMAYVALTRAKKKLYIVWTAQKMIGKSKFMECKPSSFFYEAELNPKLNHMKFTGKRKFIREKTLK